MSLVKSSKVIKKALKERLIYLYPSNKGGYKGSYIIKDALDRGFKITSEQLSRYFSDKEQKNTLSESQIIWLCLRYGIDIELKISSPPFDEAKSIEKLKLIFG